MKPDYAEPQFQEAQLSTLQEALSMHDGRSLTPIEDIIAYRMAGLIALGLPTHVVDQSSR